HQVLAQAMLSNRAQKCWPGRRAARDESVCEELLEIERLCKQDLWYRGPIAKFENGQEFYFIENHARDMCGFLNFRSLGLTLRLAGYFSDLVPGKKKEEKSPIAEMKGRVLIYQSNSADKAEAAAKEPRPEQGVKFQTDYIQRKLEDLEACFQKYTQLA